IFAAAWLCAWTGGMAVMIRQQIAAPETGSWLVVLLVMGAPELLVLGFTIYSFTARDELVIEGNELRYVRRAVVAVRRWTVGLRRVDQVDLRTPPAGRDRTQRAVEISGDGRSIVFAQGLTDGMLVVWGRLIRTRIEHETARPLPPAPIL